MPRVRADVKLKHAIKRRTSDALDFPLALNRNEFWKPLNPMSDILSLAFLFFFNNIITFSFFSVGNGLHLDLEELSAIYSGGIRWIIAD